MLTRLFIEQIALVERQELEFAPGLTLITGETGAGKSILLDALTLALGGRGDTGLIRAGSDQAMVTASFAPPPAHPVWARLQALELATDEPELHLRRVLSRAGRHRAFLNDAIVPLATLAGIGSMLVEIHGQNDQQELLQPAAHLGILDAFAGHAAEVGLVAARFHAWKETRTTLERLRATLRDAAEKREFLAFQLEELEQAAIQPGEMESLEGRRARLAHASKLNEVTRRVMEWLREGERSAQGGLGRAATELESSRRLDPGLGELADAARSLHYEVEALADRVRHYRDGLEADPATLANLEERVEVIRRLSRKHRREPDELEALARGWRQELETLERGGDEEARLVRQLARDVEAYRQEAARLTALRQAAAQRLNQEVERELRELHMGGTRFAVTLRPRREGAPGENGEDEAVFEVSPNPGEPMKPLRQIASGGELSRVMLALKTILAGVEMATTLIFDEVDTGVGGRVATSIGARLARVAGQRQVLAVTHLPQVAAWADFHWKVEKSAGAERTHVMVLKLDETARIEELARMLAGESITEPARENAREMLRNTRLPATSPAPVKRTRPATGNRTQPATGNRSKKEKSA